MYFNCPNHPKNFQKLSFLYIRRLGFCFQKQDFNINKVDESYSEKEFHLFIDLIHSKTRHLVIFYKILTVLYIMAWIFFLFFIFSNVISNKIYCLIPMFSALLIAYELIKFKEYYMEKMKAIITEENNKLRGKKVKWILGHSASFLQLYKMEEDKIPLIL